MLAIRFSISETLSFFKAYLAMVSISDIVDVLIITFCVYRLYSLLRNSNAERVIRGIAIIIVMALLSDLLKLNALNYILANTIQLGLIAIVIVFQPEIRKLLEKFGQSKLPIMVKEVETDSRRIERTILQTVEACAHMSGTKTGALIIIQRKISLDDIAKTGTILNADVSAELLKSIFFHNAALHDGAVIIKDDHIVAAACMLPLSENGNLSRDLGMRHRAAVGMSEVYDSISIIVSEETGSISVAMGGMIKRHLAPETLERLLKNELIPEPTQKATKTKWIDRIKNTK